MAQRVNFLEKGGLVFSYRTMVIAMALWIVLCAAVQVGLALRKSWASNQVVATKHAVEELNAKKDQTLKMLQIAKSRETREASAETLKSTFNVVPDWSKALIELARLTPAQIWLLELKTSDVATIAGGKQVDMRGNSSNPVAIADFITEMNRSDFFERVVMTSSQRDPVSGIYTFTVVGEVIFE